jgi:alpha-acetolactate decarboxylase
LAEEDFATRSRVPETTIFGSVHGVMMARDWSAKVKLAEVAGDGAIGVGALAGLQGEVTFLDGKAWVARVSEGKVVDSVSPEPEGEAALLVIAKVPRWRASVVSSAFDHAEIGKRVAARVSHLGLPTDKPIPFRMRASVVDAVWHVMDGSRISDDAHGHEAHMQAGHVQKRALVKADIVGFYTPNHAGLITHHGVDVHAHIILPKEGLSGHLDSGVIQAEAILMLPDPSP